MRLGVSLELSSFIAARIANYAAEATEPYHHWEAPKVAALAALPLIRHWEETIGLRAEGEVVRWHTDLDEPYPGVRPVDARYDWLSALVEGARRWPELAALLPVRPVTARDCRCVGRELFESRGALSPACCGLRWVEPDRAEPRAAPDRGPE